MSVSVLMRVYKEVDVLVASSIASAAGECVVGMSSGGHVCTSSAVGEDRASSMDYCAVQMSNHA